MIKTECVHRSCTNSLIDDCHMTVTQTPLGRVVVSVRSAPHHAVDLHLLDWRIVVLLNSSHRPCESVQTGNAVEAHT